MKIRAVIISLLFFLLSQLSFATQALYPFTSKQESERFLTLTQEIRCVVCQNQNLADSNAPLAKDLRQKIYVMVKAKKSNAEIKHYLVQRYGNFILMSPPVMRVTWLLWSFPLLALIIAAVIVRRVFLTPSRHSRASGNLLGE